MNKENQILVEAQGVSRSHDEVEIFKDVSLTVRASDSISIVGPSGSGKTTLLNLLSLLIEPSEGEVRIMSDPTHGLSDARRSELRNVFFGSVFQASHLIGSLSILDNVLVPAFLSGQGAVWRKRAGELLEELGLSSRAGYLPHMLSLGQKRRVSLARALLMRPRVILADEPTNDLDPRRASQIADYLFALPQQGYALVLVTHDATLSQRARWRYRLSDGRLTQVSTASLEG